MLSSECKSKQSAQSLKTVTEFKTFMAGITSSDELLATAIHAAHAGGAILQDWVGRFSVKEKGRADLVTEADHASQQRIFELISQKYPDHGFLGEEGLNKDAVDCDYQWVIDPLDGTSNYVHGFPYYAVSIAVRKGEQLIAGVIFDPNRNETFAATKSGGATLNGAAIKTSGETSMSMAMAMASLPVGADQTDPAVKRFLDSMSHLQTVQRSGSAALNLACVACGRIDTFWSTSLKPWDVAAGILIVEEAGGTVTDLRGGRTDIMVPSLIASCSATIAQGLISIFE
jgi:myo-inositol-1(or 4)-monophosphatase